MSIIFAEGYEAGVAGACSFTNTGTFSIQSTVKHTGDYALRSNPTAANASSTSLAPLGADGRATSATGTAKVCVNFWFRSDIHAAASDKEQFLRFQDPTTAVKLYFYIAPTGIISIHDKDNALVATGTTPLAQATWYLISAQSNNGTNSTYELKINGTTELTGTCNQLATNVGLTLLGKVGDTNSNDTDYYFDDVIGDDSDYPHASAVIKAISANANGSTMEWTAGTNSSDFNEVALPSDGGTTYVKSTGGAGEVALFDLTAWAGAFDTIVAVVSEAWMREDATSTSACGLRSRSASTNTDTSALNGSAISYHRKGIINETDPATTDDWLIGGVNALEVGAFENNAVAQRLDVAFAQVIYIPGNGVNTYMYTESGIGNGIGTGIAGRFPA